MASSIRNNIEQLQKSVAALLKQAHSLRLENKKLKEKQEEAVEKINTLQAEKDQWMQKAVALSSGAVNLPDAEKKALQKKVDSYLAEIDKCLSALNGK